MTGRSTSGVTSTDKPLRVALVHAADLGGGAERSVVSLHRSLQAAGHQSTLFVGERRTDEPGVVQIPYVRGIPGTRRVARALERRFGWQDIYNPSFRKLRRTIASGFDVVHFNSLWGSAGFADISALPALTAKVPGVLTMRENWLITGHCACFDECHRWKIGCGACPDLERVPRIPRDGTAFNWRRKYQAIQNSNIAVVAISDWLMARALESPILAGKQITRIYNGVDLETFKPCDESRRLELRLKLGMRGNEVVVLVAGQTVNGLNSFQAPKDAIRILQAASEQTRIRVLAIGQQSAAFSASGGLDVVALPYQHSATEMASCYQLADLTLVTSEAEAFGRIAAESQACATPVVAFATGAIPEVVVNNVGGLLVPRGDHQSATERILSLAIDGARRRAMGVSGIGHVHQNFSDDVITSNYIDLYRRIQAEAKKSAKLSAVQCA